MTIKYIGTRSNNEIGGYCEDKRFAEFSYKEEETEHFMKIVAYLENLGYSVDTGVEGWACVEVENADEYKTLAEDYKKAKKATK